jgi:O-antigen ligase
MVITLRHLAKFFTVAAAFSVVIVMSSTFFPFIGGKYYFFRVMTEMGLVFLLLWWAFEAKAGELGERLRSVSRQPLFIAVSAFVLAYMLATVFAYDSYGAFWSNYERGEGGFQMLHYYLFFVLLAVLFDRWADWRTVFRASIVAGVLMIAYGIVAAALVPGFIGPYSSDDPNAGNVLATIFSSSRFQGSLGNPAFVAPYLLFIMFYVAWLWLVEPKRRERHWTYGLLAAFFFVFFVLSQTRGAFLGLVAGTFVFLVVYAIMDRRRRRMIVGGIVTLLFVMVLANQLFGGKTGLESFPGMRLLTTSFSAQTAQSRLWTWHSAWLGFLERPLFGWGPENFSMAFDKYFDVRHFNPGTGGETWFDRAHSIVFDYLATTGIAGFGAFIAIFATFAYMLLRRIRRARGSRTSCRSACRVSCSSARAL